MQLPALITALLLTVGFTSQSLAQSGPDLTVDSVSVSSASVGSSVPFLINATVQNGGGGASAATTLTYYRSTDATISTLDTEIASDSISALAANGSTAKSGLTSVHTPGTYWVGACVTAVSNETNINNNCSTGVQVTITAAPDLIVFGVSVASASVVASAPFTINATAFNAGNAAAAATTLTWYRSADATISTGDTEIATDAVSALAVNGTSAENASVSIATDGIYWVGACVATVQDESNEDNNCSTGVQVTVTAPTPGPDLTVDSVSVSSASVIVSDSFTINATVNNSGDAASAATTLTWYRSSDATISTRDTELATDPVGILEADGSSAENALVSIAIPESTYWVGACVATVQDETNADNNCSTGVQVTITTGPDLAVDSVSVSSASVEADESFTINATVQNIGGGTSAATTLTWYSSTNATISTFGTELATNPVGIVEASGSSPENASVSIADVGTYWVGACVAMVEHEEVTNNNCSTGVQVTVTPAPDLTVDSVSVSSASVLAEAAFTINATVQNGGNAASAATILTWYRSTDATISVSDTVITTDPVGALEVSGSSPEDAAVAIATVGNYWVGACVAAVTGENNTNNNCSTGVQVTITPASELTVDNVSVSSASVETGAAFTINATVQNGGSAASATTTLTYYRSANPFISTDDTLLATDPVGIVAANGSSPEDASVSIATLGTWWVGACVATVENEGVAANNCSLGVQVIVTAATPSGPELTVDSVSVSNASVLAGASFTINATVNNSGDATSATTTLTWYRSPGSTISVGDTAIATDSVSALVANVSSPENASVAIADVGTWWVGACVATVQDETNAANNCSAGVQVTVNPAPELTVDSVSVSNASVETGASFTINATVQNGGSAASAATTLTWYRSTDATISVGDTAIATDSVDALAASGSSPENASVSIATVRTWWVGACVTTVQDEVNTDNNCSTGVQVTVTAATPSAPDLTVDGVSVSNTSVIVGASFTINATVNNSGNATSAATTLTWYRSTDATISVGDTAIATDPVDALTASGSSPENASVSIAADGNYWVGACIATVQNEANADNNCSTGVQVTITPAPELTVDSVSVSNASVEAGASFTINATVQNGGSAASAATTLTWYRSTNATISVGDTAIATDPVGIVAASGSSPENASVSIAADGIYWVGACVATVQDEINADNNCSTGVQVTVTVAPASAPDLTVDGVSVSSASVIAGASFTINATVQNGGNAASAATTLTWYRSTDATISVGDTAIATDPVGIVVASGSSPENALVSIATTGSYWVGGCVTAVSGETNMNNNCSTGVQVTIIAGPDLIVDNVSVSSASVIAGASFTINATVDNIGNGTAAASTLTWYRSPDATISAIDTFITTDPVSALAANGSAEENTLVSIATAGTWWVGACVAMAQDEADLGNNCSTGVQVIVTPAPTTAPDLTVDSVSVSSASVVAGISFTINAAVQNGGNAASAATTLAYYRSTNQVISTGDTQLATDAVSALAGGGSSAESASVAIADVGIYWVGACVATVQDEANADNNCSTGVQVTVTAATTTVPDLTVDSASVSSPSVVAGASFIINATVNNVGSAASAATTLTYYRSNNATISVSDIQIATDPVGVVAASGSSPENASVFIATAGNYWVGACVTAVSGETNMNNNCSRGVSVNVRNPNPDAPDDIRDPNPDLPGPSLAIRSISAPDTVAASVSFYIDVTVENRGNSASGVSTLDYYYVSLSAWEEECDEYTNQDDYEDCLDDEPTYIKFETTVAIGGLAPGASSTHSARVSIPGPETGDYLVNACVDRCSHNLPVTVTAPPPPPAPDLTVVRVSASVSRVGIGVPFMLNTTVQNAGTQATAATTLRYYRSNDATITTDDTQLTTAAVAALAPDASSSQSAEVSILDSRSRPPATTTWWVGACVDAVNNEDASNNCSSGTPVEVVSEPDLIVKDARVSDATVEAGTSFTVTATVENIGHRGSNYSSLHIYRSDDNTVSEDDSELAVVLNILSLPPSYAANNSETYTATVSISVAGAFQVIACVMPMPSVGETDDMSNNCSNPVPVTVALPPPTPPPPPPLTPDLTVENVSVTDATVEHGASLTINATVRNRGSSASPATTLRYHISDDATVTADDPQYAPRMEVGALAPGASSPQSVEITMLYPEGSYWLGACVGAVNEESATANNCSRGVQISVVVPDLTVTSVSVADASVVAGASFIINATVQNTGGATAAATTLRYFLSGAVTITTTDTELATTAVPELAPAASSQQSATVSIPDAGSYWVRACVDPVNNETHTSDNADNCAVGVPVTVIVPPDDTDTDTDAALPAILQLLLEP